MTAAAEVRQRLDKWLWYARLVKSRTLAQKLVTSGAVRVDSVRVTASDHRVGPGNVLTVQLYDRIRVLRILDTGTRRGPAPEAQALYEDISPEVPRHRDPGAYPAQAVRPPGTGRPTKKERRLVDRFTDGAMRDED